MDQAPVSRENGFARSGRETGQIGAPVWNPYFLRRAKLMSAGAVSAAAQIGIYWRLRQD